jgi:hypothetical protein
MKPMVWLAFSLAMLPLTAVAQDAGTADKHSAPELSLGDLQHDAEAGNPQSQYRLALRYFGSNEISPDDAEGLKWLRKSAGAGYALSQVSLGLVFREGTHGVQRNTQEAVNWLRKAAELGNPNGQSELGFMYERGEGVPKDEAEAVRWYTLAANQGLAIAQFDLAYMYEQGKGVAKNPQQAAKLYEIAAVRIPTARYNLASLYFRGESYPHDSIQAYKWGLLTISAEYNRIMAGDADNEPRLGRASLLLKEISKGMSKGAKTSARSLAAQWIQAHSAELGEERRNFQSAISGVK